MRLDASAPNLIGSAVVFPLRSLRLGGESMAEKQEQERDDRAGGQPQGKQPADAPAPSPNLEPGADGRDRAPSDSGRERKGPWLGGG
jgi:hypothetical protein